MNLSVVYELRERLKTAAVAGTGLIEEDFRLKRAVEQMAPLGKASPVFQKICQMAEKAMGPGCENRAEMVLDTLALVDAVLCTQGGLLKEGQWMEIPGSEEKKGTLTRIPYSRMAPVLEAFRGTGSGRYGVIREAHEKMPEIFEDYRIKGLMVKALGDSYGELAEMVADWLKTEGEEIIPLLKRDFDPAGKRDMVRRVEIIDAVAGERENDFYLQALPEAQKEVREALIGALRHEKANEEMLTELVKTEKGKLKEAALHSLSQMEGEETAKFWKKQMKKNVGKTTEYLRDSKAEWASDLIGEYVHQWLDTFEQSDLSLKEVKEEDSNKLKCLWNAARGKYSARLCDCYRRVYQVMPKETAEVLWDSLVEERHPALCKVAEELYEAYGDQFLSSVFWIDLLTKEPGEVYDRFAPYLQPEGVIESVKGLGKKKKDPMGIYQVFLRVRYEEGEGQYVAYKESWESPIRFRTAVAKLKKGLDLRWYPLLLKSKDRFDSRMRKLVRNSYDNSYDAMVAGLFCPTVEELRQDYGTYFYQGAKVRGTVAADVRMLKKCGWRDYKGLLVLTGKKNDQIMNYEIRELLSELPMTSEELAEELEELIKGYGKKAKVGIGILEMWCEKLKNGTAVTDL